VPSAMREIVALVGMEFGRSSLRSANAVADWRHGIDQLVEEAAVVDVCRGDPQGEWDAVGIGDDRPLGPGWAAIARMGTGLFVPLFAATDALSRQARLQLVAFARPKRSSRTRCSPFQIPAACQSRPRCQQVIPEPQPISRGSISQGTPLFSTNRMPLSPGATAQAGAGVAAGRPPALTTPAGAAVR
jgi:hypothetical protein